MKTEFFTNKRGVRKLVHFNELKFKELRKINGSLFYECRGYDVNGGEYKGVAQWYCDELMGIDHIEQI